MTAAEIIIWSAQLGSLGLIVLLAIADLAYTRSRAAVRSLAFMLTCWIFVLFLCGLLPVLAPQLQAHWVHVAQVLIGPLCASLGTYMGAIWLSARKRDRLMQGGLRLVTLLAMAGAPACLLLGPNWQIAAAAALTALNISVAVWLSVRAALLGDRLAWGLALACLLVLLFALGLYSLTIQPRPPIALQLGVAVLGLVGFAVFAVMFWLRNRHLLKAQRDLSSQIDPVTQLLGSRALVHKIIAAQRRQSLTQSNGVLMAVLVFEPAKLVTQVGQYGLNEIYAELARRLQRQAGVLNPVGRYYDRCFVCLVETLHSPSQIRTLGLRTAARLRRPVGATSLSGSGVMVTVDLAVGLVHFSRATRDVDQLLHDAQQLAEQARDTRSRTAMVDPFSGDVLPVEQAALDGDWASVRKAPAASSAHESEIMP